MPSSIDDRLLVHWQTSRRHQEEARRFLARTRFADPRGEMHALERVVETIAEVENARVRPSDDSRSEG